MYWMQRKQRRQGMQRWQSMHSTERKQSYIVDTHRCQVCEMVPDACLLIQFSPCCIQGVLAVVYSALHHVQHTFHYKFQRPVIRQASVVTSHTYRGPCGGNRRVSTV